MKQMITYCMLALLLSGCITKYDSKEVKGPSSTIIVLTNSAAISARIFKNPFLCDKIQDIEIIHSNQKRIGKISYPANKLLTLNLFYYVYGYQVSYSGYLTFSFVPKRDKTYYVYLNEHKGELSASVALADHGLNTKSNVKFVRRKDAFLTTRCVPLTESEQKYLDLRT